MLMAIIFRDKKIRVYLLRLHSAQVGCFHPFHCAIARTKLLISEIYRDNKNHHF
jgi:hypothetical protein